MGISSLTHALDGSDRTPRSVDDWTHWVSAGRTRNYLLNDPILDWLDQFGQRKGFKPDTQYSDFDPRTDFTEFIFRQGNAFEAAVIQHLRTLTRVVEIARDYRDIRKIESAIATFEAMERGDAVIYQGVLWDAETQTYGAPDLLVRSDELAKLFPGCMPVDEILVAGNDLGGRPWHYRVVDIKFTTLDLVKDGSLGNSGSAPAYKAQLFVYNRALGRLQGYEASTAYILGRGWRQVVKGETTRGASCMDRVVPIRQDGAIRRKPAVQAVDEAVDWIRRARNLGQSWDVLPSPSVPELWPNMGVQEDSPWHHAKVEIAEETNELTGLWQVGVAGRRAAHDQGIFSWRESRCTTTSVGVTGQVYGPTLQAILAINQTDDGPPVAPARVTAAESTWRDPQVLEFYVDFEFVTDLFDDFSKIPERGGQPLIFMIGCGHLEQGEWKYVCFTADQMDEPSEGTTIDEWVVHMETTRRRLAPNVDSPLVFHWSPAEVTSLQTAFNAARARHPDKNWPSPAWFDFLNNVVRQEPVVVRGALGFGLKTVANALHSHGLIETNWGGGPADGLGAMAGAWWCEEQIRRDGGRLRDLDLMQEIERYNEVDCKVMMEIVRYLRSNH